MGENVVLVYLVVCFFVFLAGFVDSIAGGGGLISLPAYMIAGLPVHTAIATNKMSSSMGTFVASFHYMKKGFMKWKICIIHIYKQSRLLKSVPKIKSLSFFAFFSIFCFFILCFWEYVDFLREVMYEEYVQILRPTLIAMKK